MSGWEVDGGEEVGVDVAGGMVGGSGVDIVWVGAEVVLRSIRGVVGLGGS